jgi:hypothetical protein
MDTASKIDTAAQLALLDKLSVELVRGLSEDFTKSVDWSAYPWAREMSAQINLNRASLHMGGLLPGQNGNNDGMGEWT